MLSLNVAARLLMESMTLLMPNRRAGELADMSARPGRRLQTDIINHPSATGQSNKMANGSVGAEKALQTQTTKKKMTPAETCGLLMPIFSTPFRGKEDEFLRLGEVKSIIYGAINLPVT